jgi:hypothetical protein
MQIYMVGTDATANFTLQRRHNCKVQDSGDRDRLAHGQFKRTWHLVEAVATGPCCLTGGTPAPSACSHLRRSLQLRFTPAVHLASAARRSAVQAPRSPSK